jgi:hypothetical protein
LKNIHSQLKETTILQLHPNLMVVVFCPTGKAVPDISKECNGFKTSGTTSGIPRNFAQGGFNKFS